MTSYPTLILDLSDTSKIDGGAPNTGAITMDIAKRGYNLFFNLLIKPNL